MKPLTLALFLLAACVTSTAVAGECTLDDTTTACQERLANQHGLKLIAASKEPENQETEKDTLRTLALVAEKNTGAVEAVLRGAGTKADFNSLVNFLIDSGALGTDENEDESAFAFDVTNFLGLDARHGYKVQFVGRDAQLFQAIRDEIPEADRDATVVELEKGLSRLSDTSLLFSYNPTGQRLARGRNPDNYQEELGDLWTGEVAKVAAQDKLSAQLQTEFLRLLREAPISKEEREALNSGAKPFRDVLGDGPKALELLSLLEKSSGEFFAATATLAKAAQAKDDAITQFAKLIDNQPQWVVGIEQTYRDPLAGPDELKLKGSYEYGFANVRALKAYCNEKSIAALADCLPMYFAEKTPFAVGVMEDRVDAGHRMAFTVEYSEVDDYKFDPGDDLDEVAKKGDHEVKVSLGYSRYLNLGKAIGPNTRFDLAYTYEDSGSDKAKNDRHVGQAILSIPAANKTFFTVGVKYSSDPKFVGEVDKELSTRVGLVFKPFQPEDPAKP